LFMLIAAGPPIALSFLYFFYPGGIVYVTILPFMNWWNAVLLIGGLLGILSRKSKKTS
jgi:hypothetical protein